MLHAIIMAGGSGTRFWPQSRQQLPKQLLCLSGDRTMIQQTVDRCESLIPPENVRIVTNAVQAELTREQLPELDAGNVLVEPAARNTAPCIGLAAIHALHADPDAVMFVMPADHVITPIDVFQQTAKAAVDIVNASPERLVLFGITPAFPATGYGYIEQGDALAGTSAFEVKSFREKPAAEIAEEYVASGRFFWNCGIFCWRADTILKHLQEQEADSYEHLMAIQAAIGTPEYDTVLNERFPQMNSISIDYAVLEKAGGVTVIEAPYTWDDVGSWLAVPRLAGSDDQGNTRLGDTLALDTSNSIIRSTDDHLIATLGVDDLIIVHTPDATLVAKRGDSERIKEVLASLKDAGRTELL